MSESLKDDFFGKNNLNKSLFKKNKNTKNKSGKKRFLWIILIILIIFLSGGCFVAYKTGYILNKISESDNSSMGSFLGVLSAIGIKQNIARDEQGRTNVLLLGMRGENMPGGGLLADTIMVASLKMDQAEGGTDDKIGLISIPRDLYVNIPETNQYSKINSVYYYGEVERENETGISYMKKVISEVTGLDIHYGVSLSFKGFEDLVDAVGGLEIDLSEPFIEPVQFHEMKVCDGDKGGAFTVKTGEFEHKKDDNGRIVKSYPLCYNSYEECGGIFSLPAGKQTLDGEKALCYVRSRATSSDFDRAKRQQLILDKLKEKLISLGTFSDFSKVNGILNAVGDNIKTDMNSSEMKSFFDEYLGIQNAKIYHKVLDNSPEGLLVSPTDYPEEVGYILIPKAGQANYSEIQGAINNMFN
jgi:anionic cell wall polymer biosynthesis LytR-Cps2A-Psr (LCP) family protein